MAKSKIKRKVREAREARPGDPPVVETYHTEAEELYLEDLYTDLQPEADMAYVQYFLARTPAHLQEDMKDLVRANMPNPPDEPTGEALSNERMQAAVALEPGPRNEKDHWRWRAREAMEKGEELHKRDLEVQAKRDEELRKGREADESLRKERAAAAEA